MPPRPRSLRVGLEVAARAQAAPQQQSDNCYPYTGDGGACSGSFYGFANDPTQPTYANFSFSSNGMWFSAAYRGSYFYCAVPPSNTALQDIFRATIEWNWGHDD